MSDTADIRGESAAPPQEGLPLGGLGTGYFELGKDGRFRNLSINNNRRSDEVIPEAPNSFIAVRASAEGRHHVRVLRQTDDTGTDDGARGFEAHEILHRSTYPSADFQFMSPDFPLQVTWSTFAPVIPFDYDAATMPAVFLSLRLRNLTALQTTASIVFNWEHLAGSGAGQGRGHQAVPLQFELEDRKSGIIRDRKPEPKKSDSEDGDDAEPLRARFNALLFESSEDAPFPGEHCIAVDYRMAREVSTFLWDPDDPEDVQTFWKELTEEGGFQLAVPSGERRGAGALCAEVLLPAGGESRVDFVLSWYAPQLTVEGEDLGSGYANRFDDAAEVAHAAVRRAAYFFRSVEDWQRRLSQASIPKWLGRMLSAACAAFTTNTIHTRDGRILMLASPGSHEALPHHFRLQASFGMLLFFPRFEENELGLIAQAEEQQGTGELPSHFDYTSGYAAAFDGDAHRVQLAAQYVLTAYRNFCGTGNMNRLQTLYPSMKRVIARVLRMEGSIDGLPRQAGERETVEGILVRGEDVVSAGLWCVALKAYAELARHMGEKEESLKSAALCRRAAARFESLFWDDERGYFRLCAPDTEDGDDALPGSDACHEGQLAGPWAAAFLNLGPIFRPSQVRRALETIEAYNERSRGLMLAALPDGRPVANASGHAGHGDKAWPGSTASQFSAMSLYAGNFESGLRVLEKYYRNIHYKAGLRYATPLRWNLEKNCPDGPLGHPAILSLWHALYAMEGVHFHVPAGRLTVMPRLPKGTHSLEAPLFLPSCFGWLQFKEERGLVYRLHCKTSFDSPVRIEELRIRVPQEMPGLECSLDAGDGPLPTSIEATPCEGGQQLAIRPARPLIGVDGLTVQVTWDESKLPKEDEKP